ncbi:heparan-alpha-glucosaminide N-acetyltransferase domain-containing protein [Georgenia daeguensis]|uniref:Heparan-alpha-glucosaminide N-acetyltransferase catalytic domain-containing protein n=1 Tax=Georgenia daeguensis TaxID=908355 RepID=A0ABP6UP00_9MICO
MSPPVDRVLPPRLVGIDVARGLAVLGMFVAHLGDDGPDGRHDPEWFVIADGRSSALFALLAGVSLALTSGRQVLPSGVALIRARLAAFVRAGILLLLGVFLVALGTPVLVILPAYAVLFALAAPFLGLRRRWVVVGAVTAAAISPTVIFALTTPTADGRPSALARLTNLPDPVRLPMDEFVTGPYPALVFLAYVLLGMAVGHSDLSRVRTHTILVGAGTVLACLAWGTSRLAQDSLGPDAAPLARRLVSAAAHDNSTLEVIGNSGTSLALIGLCLLVTRPMTTLGRNLARGLAPVAAAGAMPLTVYSLQILAIFLLGNDVVWNPQSNAVLIWFIATALIGAWSWRHFLGRGPLERLLKTAVDTALRSSSPPPPPSPRERRQQTDQR